MNQQSATFVAFTARISQRAMVVMLVNVDVCTQSTRPIRVAGPIPSASARLARAVTMYICEICKTQTEPNVPCHVTQVEVREKVYPPRTGDPGGSGFETVREVRACPSCAPALARQNND